MSEQSVSVTEQAVENGEVFICTKCRTQLCASKFYTAPSGGRNARCRVCVQALRSKHNRAVGRSDRTEEPVLEEGEEIRPIAACPGYFVTSLGGVFASRTNSGLIGWKRLKYVVSKGQRRISIRTKINGIATPLYFEVGRLVLEAFTGFCPDDKSCEYINGDKNDCRPSTLRLGSKRGHVTHGQTRQSKHSSIYGIWHSMNMRCHNPNAFAYGNYGARGISVCERWKTFQSFLLDMGERPEGMSLDRINNNGNYEPANCRWATTKEQQRNSRHSRMIEHDGRVQPLVAWAEELGVDQRVLQSRLQRGWSAEKAITTPFKTYKQKSESL